MKRSVTNHSLHGVCAGIAHHLGLYPMAIRLLFIVTLPFSFFLYIILANTMDADRASF
ncbi:PspC domain-containing protein [Halobacillus trueperi]|uniref:Phage shock protein PspC (Stress-responsive transcriptional regulator) n=2 Tax=Halobacillus TaxID=45667 RepID=A0A1H0FM23_HALAD|nr:MULTISPECIES: PspC domain-containing protein [Halobacillus]RDY71112.1 PspC domain-containing protein [Halobacillus trueperi]SDN95634.1 Phage shock protein PspC (stress-responsive transcriptional regulator) [Halobacillus aidingensis]